MDDPSSLVVRLLFGVCCGMLASSRGRSGVGWGILGFLFVCLPLGLLLLLNDLTVEEDRHRKLRRENLRLREQLKKDRAVADARQASTEQRLTAHDRALGLDTAPASLDGPEQDVPPLLLAEDLVDAQWYYLDQEREQRGPIPLDELAGHWRGGEIDGSTLVWTRSFEEWTPLADVPGLEGELRG